MSVVVLVADGVRPDTLRDALDAGGLPTLAAMREAGGLHTITSCFPSVTGLAYAPFLMGRFAGPVGLPGLRWFDRARETCRWPDYTRSYIGYQMGALDGDLAPDAPTLFELVPDSLGALSVIARGLPARRRIGGITLRSAARAAYTHFRGDVRGWLRVDREVADELTARIRRERPRYVFAALTGVDKASHAVGHEAPLVHEALRIVDDTAGRIRRDAQRDGWVRDLHLWVVSDHGHAEVHTHEDLAGLVASLGHRVIAHPWVYRPRAEVAVMVSGNAMAHLYLELARRERPWWPALAPRWEPLAASLLARESTDLLLLPHSPTRCEVRGRGRGRAMVERVGGGDAARFRYAMVDGDPLGIGADVELDADAAFDRTREGDYPDSLVQIAQLAGSTRAGEMILSATPGWDFRSRYEPIPHVSAHGALHRDHMNVPLLLDRPAARAPRRTVDVMPSTLAALGLPIPAGLDGRSFL